MSGSIFRRKIVYGEFKRKTMNSNPRRGHIHYRSPSKILWRTIRGMVPHKTARGAAALDRLKTFEGIPHPYDAKKRVVVPAALKVLRLRPHRRWTKLGDLSSQVGWHCQELLKRLEEKRKVKSSGFYQKKKAAAATKRKAIKAVKLDNDSAKVLADAGF